MVCKLFFSLSFFVFAAIAAACQPVTVIEEAGVENAYPRLSKDGGSVLCQSNKSGKWRICICFVKPGPITYITDGAHNDNFPDWSYDNQWIAFVSDRDGNEEIYLCGANGKDVRRVTTNTARDIHPYFSPDGKYLLFNSDREGAQFDVYRYEIATGKTERLTNTPDNETCARYAPDMQSIVLLRNSEVSDDVFLLHLTDFTSDNITKTSRVYHGWPVFSYDGRWVYYSSMEGGTYSIYRIRPDGTGKQQLTHAGPAEEHARVSLSRDGHTMIYNVRKGKTISIVKERLPG